MFSQFTQILLYLLISLNITLAHPINEHPKIKMGMKDEKKYPNGTIIGKYNYKDKDGNPVHVKYFADDSSYGVEFKSVKVFGSHPELLKDKVNFETMTSDAVEPLNEANTANSLLSKEFHSNRSYNPFEIFNYPREKGEKDSLYRRYNKPKQDYEIFLENDLQPSQKCEKEKIRVYSDKSKRKIREVADNNKLFCEQY